VAIDPAIITALTTDMRNKPPAVLAIGGHDPTGGAGVTADVQTLSRLGCHPASIVTAITEQDTHSVKAYRCLDSELVRRQCETLLNDLDIAVIKTGMLASGDTLRALAPLLIAAGTPLVIDPVLAGGGGGALADDELRDSLITELIPHASMITPNLQELRALTGSDDIAAASRQLLKSGCANILVTTTDAGDTDEIIHQLFAQDGSRHDIHCQRLAGHYHGSGCTLASAIAAYLALGTDILAAVKKAHHFTYTSLQRAYRLSDGQHLPNRLHDAD